MVNDFLVLISQSNNAQISGRSLAGFTIGNEIEGDVLSLVEAIHSSPFDRADMDEHILAAVSRLNEAISLLAVEPLYSSLRHKIRFSVCACACAWIAAALQVPPVQVEFWEHH